MKLLGLILIVLCSLPVSAQQGIQQTYTHAEVEEIFSSYRVIINNLEEQIRQQEQAIEDFQTRFSINQGYQSALVENNRIMIRELAGDRDGSVWKWIYLGVGSATMIYTVRTLLRSSLAQRDAAVGAR